jgi:hypothetical protein
MEHYHDAVAEHTVPFVGIEPGARYFLPLAENPGRERLPVDPDVPHAIASMRRAVEQPITQSPFWHAQLIRQFANRVKHWEQAWGFHDDMVGKLDTRK